MTQTTNDEFVSADGFLRTARPARARVWGLICGALVFSYHVRHSLAEVVAGSVSDGVISAAWEYDLEQGTGRIVIENLALPLDEDDQQLSVGGLLTSAATNVDVDDAVAKVNPCTDEPPPTPYVFASLPAAKHTEITFDFEPTTVELIAGPLDYSTAFLMSAVGCLVLPKGKVQDFVSVRPIVSAVEGESTKNEASAGDDGFPRVTAPELP